MLWFGTGRGTENSPWPRCSLLEPPPSPSIPVVGWTRLRTKIDALLERIGRLCQDGEWVESDEAAALAKLSRAKAKP